MPKLKGNRTKVDVHDTQYDGYQYPNGFYIYKMSPVKYKVWHGPSSTHVWSEPLPRKKMAVEALEKFMEALTQRFPDIKYDEDLAEQMYETDLAKYHEMKDVTSEIWEEVQRSVE